MLRTSSVTLEAGDRQGSPPARAGLTDGWRHPAKMVVTLTGAGDRADEAGTLQVGRL
jgi:hypothetical protein